MPTTLADVARKAGCSSATVSRVLAGTGQISRDTRETVLKAARALKYEPHVNRRAASLDAAGAVLIEVVVHRRSPYERLTLAAGELKAAPPAPLTEDEALADSNRLSNSFNRRIVDGLIDEASRWDCRVALRTTDDLASPSLVAELNAARAVVLMGEYSPHLASFVRSVTCPLVLLDLLTDRAPPAVTIDNARGIADAVGHLTGLGHTEIGFVAGPADVVAFAERRAAFRARMVDAGLAVNRAWIYEGRQHMVDVAAWTEKLLGRTGRPTALVCCNDFMALAAVKAAAACRVAVPRELSVVGFDDIEPAALVTPALTTVRAPTREMGRQAVRQMMLELRAGRADSGVVVRIAPELVVRESTAKARA